MPDLRFRCPVCEAKASIDESFYGKVVVCPSCKKEVQLPERPEPERPAPPVATLLSDEPAATSSGSSSGSSLAEPPSPGEEETVAQFRPAYRARLAILMLSGLLVLLGLVLLIVTSGEGMGSTLLRWMWVGVMLAGAGLAAKVWYLVHSTLYTLTTQRFQVQTGLIAKKIQELELYRIKDVQVEQSFWERLLKTGSVTVISADKSSPSLPIRYVIDPIGAKELLRDRYREARKREGVKAAERFYD